MINEKFLEKYSEPVSLKGTEIILKQMKTAICKIYVEDGSKGTGFFCKIPEEILEEISDKNLDKDNFMKALKTNYHVINEKQKTITISINNDKKYINLENKELYKDENDIIIIDVKNQKK